MPEGLAHLAFARLCRELPPVARLLGPEREPTPGTLALYYCGALLPDLVTRPFHILFPRSGSYVVVLHAPFCQLLWAVVIARAFAPAWRARVFAALVCGAATHLVLDLIQRHLAGGYYLAFPLSFARSTAGLVWPEDTLLLTPVLLAAALALTLFRRRRA